MRYGDEIGMGDDLSLKERECARTPMQWTSKLTAASPERSIRKPRHRRWPLRLSHVNVADQRHDAGSLLNWMQGMIRQRKEAPEIGWGAVVPLETGYRAFGLRYEWRGNSVLCLHNFDAKPVELSLDSGVAKPAGAVLVDL